MKPLILVIEDDRDIAQLLSTALAMERFIPMVDDLEVRGKLIHAIDGKGAFGFRIEFSFALCHVKNRRSQGTRFDVDRRTGCDVAGRNRAPRV